MTVTIPLIIAAGILAWVLRPGKAPSKPRKAAILAAVIPPLVIAIAAVFFQVLYNTAGLTWLQGVPDICFIISIILVGAAVLALAGFLIARKWDIARGIGFGICIGFIICIIEFGVLEWLAGV